MPSKTRLEIVIRGARTNNLKDISLRIPHNKLIAVTGISGSGKSSLVFEIIAKEGQRRYFETLPSFSRQFMGKLSRPEVDEIEGLSPVIAIGQRTTGMHARSTVGTMSDIYDLLRLLFARAGVTDKNIELSRALFSFNSAVGKCKRCNGIGKEEQIDLNRLIVFPEKSIREGALAPTLPNGYIMYSQVTIDVLNQVCEAEGFNVDIPWKELTDQQRKVVLYGSDKIKVPFGKHSLESRLKWTGIKAKPREEGHYKGMIPIMSDILRRDRNANILKYVRAVTCPSCNGTRLNDDALSVTVQGKSIAEIVTLELNALKTWIRSNTWEGVAHEIIKKIEAQVDLLEDLGLGHLTLDRSSKSLRASEIQRIRVANQILVPLSDVLYVFDEPSIGLHPEENERLIYHFKQLVKKGNTVIVVEHDIDTITNADHIIEIGPEAGVNGGELIFNGPFLAFSQKEELKEVSPTYRAIKYNHTDYNRAESQRRRGLISGDLQSSKIADENSKAEIGSIRLIGCQERNLKNIDVEFQLGKLNVVSGQSGTGKSSLVKGTLLKVVRECLEIDADIPAKLARHENIDTINKLIFIDHSPIGKTPRSNPATYLGLSDHIRDLYASLPESKAQGFTKSRFSFNNKGGRCETCQGAGKTQIGMHFLGNVDLVCGTCNGDRFNKETLQIKYNGLSIADTYKLSINEAIAFFDGHKKVLTGLKILQEIGLGYLTLGQSSTTLSGGEAQRIKIANQLQKKDTGDTLYVIIEPSIGLHHDDIKTLLLLFDRIKQKGNTIVCIEQSEAIIGWGDWHIELGPKGGANGGEVVYQGIPRDNRAEAQRRRGLIANDLQSLAIGANKTEQTVSLDRLVHKEIILNGVTTHGLKNIDVRIPKNQLTVVTGVSGSGKSSLVYDTLFAESNARFTESLSTYNRSFLQQNSEAKIASFSGLGPAIGINRKGGTPSKRSTVGTLSGVYDAFRLLYSRIAQQEGETYTAQHFSFNHHLGACPECEGLGIQRKCNPDEVVIAREKSIFEGALSVNKAVAYYADRNGQFMATLKEVAKQLQLNIDRPWLQLEEEIKEIILYGTGDAVWNVTWDFTTKSRTGTQSLSAKWLGFCNYIDEEYQRKRHNKNIKALEDLLHDVVCPTCQGSRLKPELANTKFLGKSIHELSQLSIVSALEFMEQVDHKVDPIVLAISKAVLPAVTTSLKTIVDLGLGYLSIDRTVSTLSGGERQRVTLAGQLSTHLFGVIYVLDEPTIGLDKEQVAILSKVLKSIVANGNTVVVVEHDPSFIQNADYLIEMGPGAGDLGGEVIYQGKVSAITDAKHSVTYQLLQKQLHPLVKKHNKNGAPFGVKGAFANNLKNIDVNFYARQITAIKGVSGSGKSSLIKEVLYRSWLKNRPVGCTSVNGLDQFEEVLLIDQEPLKQSRSSTPVSYTGILEQLKTTFSKTDSAKDAGWKKADFSYQSKNGKCGTCAGLGKLKTSMDFMSDIWLTCDTCKGMRYNEAVLACKYKGRSIGEILRMTVQEAIVFFDTGAIVENLKILKQVGVGHLRLGQSGNTLSGGEAQRLKLAKSLMQKRKGTRLYLFDEPSTGLHYFDILQLITVLQSIIDSGDTLLFIEHNSILIDAADRVITLGPGSGVMGGEVV
ncbi:ATP-binding cassette domain-containing protein [Lewinella cohaerens]|uniref:ATP-binding cassette domain-containing protein n=1 Tax=Lewinella cohaerens TaxID=70995 RepID=UPI0003726360|nr:excinuclease ABC subunit UvrA [Lewinella cohaerens]